MAQLIDDSICIMNVNRFEEYDHAEQQVLFDEHRKSRKTNHFIRSHTDGGCNRINCNLMVPTFDGGVSHLCNNETSLKNSIFFKKEIPFWMSRSYTEIGENCSSNQEKDSWMMFEYFVWWKVGPGCRHDKECEKCPKRLKPIICWSHVASLVSGKSVRVYRSLAHLAKSDRNTRYTCKYSTQQLGSLKRLPTCK